MKKALAVAVLVMVVGAGCQSASRTRQFEQFGKAYYLDGAGNLGFGHETVVQGLRQAGVAGDVENIIWTTFTGPLGDQLIRVNARLRAKDLTRKIVEYKQRHPDAPVYVIGLSAGTGVATWAVESLPDAMQIDTMVLLGSSLSSGYDMSKALTHVRDKVHVIYSPRDAVLTGFIPVTGTIDGQYLVEPAGLVGMRAPGGASSEAQALYSEKINNIPWCPAFERLDYAGGHTDGTSFRFVRHYIGPKLLNVGHTASAATTQPAGSVIAIARAEE